MLIYTIGHISLLCIAYKETSTVMLSSFPTTMCSKSGPETVCVFVQAKHQTQASCVQDKSSSVDLHPRSQESWSLIEKSLGQMIKCSHPVENIKMEEKKLLFPNAHEQLLKIYGEELKWAISKLAALRWEGVQENNAKQKASTWPLDPASRKMSGSVRTQASFFSNMYLLLQWAPLFLLMFYRKVWKGWEAVGVRDSCSQWICFLYQCIVGRNVSRKRRWKAIGGRVRSELFLTASISDLSPSFNTLSSWCLAVQGYRKQKGQGAGRGWRKWQKA